MAANIASRLSTRTPYFEDLIKETEKGEVKIPQFQRPFVWKAQQALSLLDSISRNYPIGSLLLWRTSDKLATERNIGDFQLPETDDLSPTNYVLDGQQRLTVIYSSFAAANNDDQFSASYDLKEQTFVETPESSSLHVFPLSFIYDTTALLNFRTALLSQPKSELLQERLDELVGVITRYQVPVVELRDLTLEEVCPIFERINSSGTRLSTYDLMVAATWSKEFDLNERVQDILLSLKSKGFDDLPGDTILKVLAAINSGSIRRETILALRKLTPTQMDALVVRAKKALQLAVDLLATEFKMHSADFLPYEAHVVVLAFVCEKTGVLNEPRIRRVRQWFWRTAFTERYRGASEAFISRDLDTIHSFVLDGKGDVARRFGQSPSAEDLMQLRFRKNNSGSRAFALALAKLGPRNITNGAAIDTFEALSVYNKKQFHHIFPEAHLKRVLPSVERSFLMNMCMLAASENNLVSDGDPAVYLPECITKLGGTADAVLASNLLPLSSYSYANATYSDFLSDRADLATQYVAELCNGLK